MNALAPTQAQAAPPLAPGSRITWQRFDGKAQSGVVDFLHTYPGEVWAFCGLSDGEWCALNVKCILSKEHGHGEGTLPR